MCKSPGPENFQDCPASPRPKFDCYPTLPQRFYSLPRPAHPEIFFFCPAPPKKGCPCIPDADDLGDDDHDDHDDHDDGDCKYFWRWSPKSYRNIYLGLEQFPWWEGKGGGTSIGGDLPETFSVSGYNSF